MDRTTIEEYNQQSPEEEMVLTSNVCPNCDRRIDWYRFCNSINDQPERLNPTAFEDIFPPPWNPNEHPEKTKGWIEFQREMKKHPKYYLQGFDSLNSMET